MSASGDRLRRYAERAAHEGGKAAAEAMAGVGQDGIRHELRRKSHAVGSRTPSSPGEPPAFASGRLWASIQKTPAVSAGPYRWESSAGTEGLIYAKVQARGATIRVRSAPWLVFRVDGITYRKRQVRIPPRPYVPPAARRIRSDGSLHRAAVEAFHRAVYG